MNSDKKVQFTEFCDVFFRNYIYTTVANCAHGACERY